MHMHIPQQRQLSPSVHVQVWIFRLPAQAAMVTVGEAGHLPKAPLVAHVAASLFQLVHYHVHITYVAVSNTATGRHEKNINNEITTMGNLFLSWRSNAYSTILFHFSAKP